MTDNGTDTTASDLVAVVRQLADLLDAVGAGDAHAATPCTQYDVTQLRNHVLGWLTAFTDGLSDAGGKCSDSDAVAVEGSGGDQVRECAGRLEAALTGGALPEQVMIGDSGMPTSMALSMILWEYQMHGWDLAAATGQPWSPAAGGLEASLEFAPMMLTDDYQGDGKTFGPRIEVADDAPALDRLLGLSGRDPSWSAG